MRMTDKRPLSDAELDGLFAASRRAAPAPSDDLMARVLGDAAEAAAPAAVPAPRRAGRRGLLAQIGGWPAAAGLAAAAVAGLAIGLWQPEALDDLTGGYLASAAGYEIEDLLPSYGDLLGEG